MKLFSKKVRCEEIIGCRQQVVTECGLCHKNLCHHHTHEYPGVDVDLCWDCHNALGWRALRDLDVAAYVKRVQARRSK